MSMDTKVIKVNPEMFDDGELKEACEILKRNGLVAFPTETVYGLGGDGMHKEASAKIYAAKGRPSDNPLIIHIADRKSLDEIASEVSKKAEKLMDAFWPGPMTLIFRKKENVPMSTTGGLENGCSKDAESSGGKRAYKTVWSLHSCTECKHFGKTKSHKGRACYRRPFGKDRYDNRRR